jgi:hypothetical protein
MIDPQTTVRSYKLGCIVRGEPDRLHYNGCRFATAEECEEYGRDLYRRWTMLDGYVVVPSPDPVSYRMVDGHAYSLRSLEGGEGVQP